MQQPYPPPSQKPLPHQRFWRWLRQRSKKVQIIACVILVLSCSLCWYAANTSLSAAPITATPTVDATATQQDALNIQATATREAQIQLATIVAAPTDTPVPTDTPAPTATSQVVHYPPKTVADLRSLAAKGDASAIYEFHGESVGAVGACPQPKREVTVDPSVTGQQLAEDLLAYFYAQQLDNPCGSVVFAYHGQGEANDGPYTAGRILVDVTDSSGTSNVDPNATNLKYTLTLDIGGAITNQQEYVITY